MRVTIITTTAALLAAVITTPAAAVECDRFEQVPDPGRVTAAEFDQLRDGMTLEQVQALFGSPGAIAWASEYTVTKSMSVDWYGSVRLVDWTGWIDEPEISVVFSADKATFQTVYKRVKVKVKKVKRAKRLGLRTWRWKTVERRKPVAATPYVVDYFSLTGADILRQTRALSCSSL